MDERKPPTVIEQTAKRYKAIQAVGVLVAALGGVLSLLIVVMYWNRDVIGVRDFEPPAWITALLIAGTVCGLATYATGKVLAWWHHG